MTYFSDNQAYLKDVINSVLEGQGVGWLKTSRIKKLMEDENYRNFVVSRLNTALDKKLTDEDLHLEDVVSTKHRRQTMLVSILRPAPMAQAKSMNRFSPIFQYSGST